MPLVFVTAWDRRANKYVKGDTCDEIIRAAINKLGVAEPCKLYIDSKEADAGTEIDEDEILTDLANDAKENGKKLTLFIAPENEKHMFFLQGPDVTPSAPAVQGPCFHRDTENTPRDPATTPRSRPQVDRYTSLPLLTMDSIIKQLEDLKAKCQTRNCPTDLVKAKSLVAKSLAKKVVDHIVTNIEGNYSREIATFYGDAILNCNNGEFRQVFNQSLGAEQLDDGRDWFICKIYNGLNYKKPEDLKKKRPRREPVSSQPAKRVMGRSKDYGCKNYVVTLPVGKTPESQAEKRERLKNLHEAQDWGQAAETLFRQTFPSQRSDIIGTRPLSALATDFIPRWPILQKGKFLILHGELLTDVTVTSYHELLGERSKDIIKYMRQFWANEEIQLRSTRRKRTAVAADMLKILRDMDDACTAGRSGSFRCAAVFPLLCGFMGEDFEMMAATVNVLASEEEIREAISVSNENPIILIQGDGIFDPNASFSVHILNTIRIDASNFLEAAMIWFLAFYVFDFCYTSQVQHTLEFFQRFLVGINPPTGDRRQNPKRHVSVASDRVVTLVEELRLASSPWVIPEESEDDI